MNHFNMPWFPFWVDDFITSRRVAFLSMEEVGVYVVLLCHAWKDGPLPDDAEFLGRLIRAEPDTVRTVLEQCFEYVDGMWINERLEDERDEAEAKHQKRVAAGRASGRARRNRKGRKKNEHRSNNAPTKTEQPQPQPQSQSQPETQKEEEKSKEVDTGESSAPAEGNESPLLLLHPAALEVLRDIEHPNSKNATARTLEWKYLARDEDAAMLDASVNGLAWERRMEVVAAALIEYGDQATEWNANRFSTFVRKVRNRPRAGTEAAAVLTKGEPGTGGYKPSQAYTEDEPTELTKIDARALLESFGVSAPRGEA